MKLHIEQHCSTDQAASRDDNGLLNFLSRTLNHFNRIDNVLCEPKQDKQDFVSIMKV